MSKKHTETTFKGVIHVLCGRGRTGKSTWARWAAERAIASNRALMIVDGDRTNSTLASFFPDARRPTHADDLSVEKALEEVTADIIETGGNALIDMGGGDQIFAAVAERKKFFTILPRYGIDIVCWHFATGGRDDLETLVKMAGMGLTSRRMAIVFNEGLAPLRANGVDPFESLLAGRTLSQAIKNGARVVRMPAVPMATMIAADNLFVGIRAASEGGVPLGENGRPHPDAAPLSFWRRMELEDWLAEMDTRHEAAEVMDWLP